MSVPNQGGPIQTGAVRVEARPAGVTIADIDIPFGRLVAFFVKAALAAVPATLILWVIMGFVAMVLGTLFGFGQHGWMMVR
ncbi:hypothetical protein NK718_00640 [Alsobacter sp. SYSU M60028]|uniref:Uncharacterized protein n=1 Tax=Alsobacter ponti TaxID=2962936 RepID=A0ABT1L7S7_9HYPH|nr:hypothetical protein [Alsobacter ponti]MCP8937011.1 hypothetical protein [Alsobacter ponti]